MDVLGFEVEAQTPAADDLALEAGRWFADLFGVVPRLTAYVTDLDAVVAGLAAQGAEARPLDGGDDAVRAARVTGPGGIAIDVVQPAPSGDHERAITEFIDSAAGLAGPPTDALADDVSRIVAAAWEAIDARLEGVAHNKVLATQLLLGQRARTDTPDSSAFWQRSAASTLLSGFVGRGVSDEPPANP